MGHVAGRICLAGWMGIASIPAAIPAAGHTWHIRFSGGDDSAGGANWNQAWATPQKAWDEVARIMGGGANSSTPGCDHSFDIRLERTIPGQSFSGAASSSAWWGSNATGAVKRADVMLRGGYDPESGLRLGVSAIMNAVGSDAAIYANLNGSQEQSLRLCFYDVAVQSTHSAVRVTDSRIPRVFAYRSWFSSSSALDPVVEINGSSASYAYGWFDRSRISGGGVGIWIRSAPYKYSMLCLTNCAVTGSATAGIRVQNGANYDAPTVVGCLRNVTISHIGGGTGTAILVEHTGYDYHHDLRLNLDGVLVANVGTGVAFSRDFDERLVLTGECNAFYNYAALTNVAGIGTGAVVDELSRADRQPAGDARLKTDGYHLQATSPAANRYSLTTGDPVVDIDGDPRPASGGWRGDIGCDEFSSNLGTIVWVQ